ncbi:rod shape-determining protein MreC [Brucepastera parasyntrophica]|uniref:rod shape-determining protein MreC n=1 Tax=Brucepastera parasyntrophica TaxID=2880008 RepID=UPI002108E63D|nr:rod shape-determining protein MreC [Brucepastera parasyntrophica]ULQ59989.1 rod shape-determining protein MreC [Brucepastera parasyntrophica]
MQRKRKSFRFNQDFFLLAIYLLVSGILLAFTSGGFVVNFKQIGFSLMSGVQKGVYSVTSFFTGTVSAIKELSELKTKYNELIVRLEDYELLQRSNADIRAENEKLKELLGFSDSLPQKNIPAEIIGRDPNNLYSGITINRGSRHGIRKNMPVVSFQGSNTGLVGKVVQVGRSTSLIMPIYDYQSYVSTRLETSRFDGLINGQGNPDATLIMKYVKKRAREEMVIGEMVLTSGENNNFPKDIPVGFVSGIRGIDYETSLELDIEPIIDFSRLENVFVLDMNVSQSEDD